MEGELGVIEPGKLADVLILDADPLKDIRVLQGGKHLSSVIKDGRQVDLHAQPEDEPVLALP
ncbi:MAG: amidohydrolase family protein [Chloroflexi bacterium]|nr:amidohydrolase family protein [Chloroflexota bacterium]